MSTDDLCNLLDRLDPLADAHRLIAAVEAVLDEHPRYEGDFSDFCGHCQARGEGTWPCPTVTAIHAALIGGDHE